MAKRKSSSNAITSHAQTVALKDATRKRKAKKWSKGKRIQTQSEVDGAVSALYDAHAMQPPQESAVAVDVQDGTVAAVQALEQTLRGL